DPVRSCPRDDPLDIALPREAATILAEQGDRAQAAFFARRGSAHDVLGVAAGAEHDQRVAGAAEGLHPAAEDLLKAVVVADARDVPGVDAGDRGQRRAIVSEAAGEFLAEVHGIARR